MAHLPRTRTGIYIIGASNRFLIMTTSTLGCITSRRLTNAHRNTGITQTRNANGVTLTLYQRILINVNGYTARTGRGTNVLRRVVNGMRFNTRRTHVKALRVTRRLFSGIQTCSLNVIIRRRRMIALNILRAGVSSLEMVRLTQPMRGTHSTLTFKYYDRTL